MTAPFKIDLRKYSVVQFSWGEIENVGFDSGRKINKRKFFLCTGVSLYAPYSLLLISSKFWMGGGGGESVGDKRGGGG